MAKSETTTTKTKTAPETALVPTAAAGSTELLDPSAEIDLSEYGEDAGKGFENNEQALMKLPLVKLLQSGSPIVKLPKNQRPAHLAGAEAGFLLDTISEELFDVIRAADGTGGGLEVVPVHYARAYLERKPDMGGFVARREPTDPQVREALRLGSFADYHIGENDLDEVIELYMVYRSPKTGGMGQVVMGLESTAISAFKEWNGKIARFAIPNPDPKGKPYTFPLFAHRIKLSSVFVPEANKKPSYFKLAISPAYSDADGAPSIRASLLPKSDPRYACAKEFQAMIVANEVVVDHAAGDREPAAGGYKPDNDADPGFAGKAKAGF